MTRCLSAGSQPFTSTFNGRWKKYDLKQEVEELGLQKQQIVILINPSELTAIPQESTVLGYAWNWDPSGI